MAGCLDSFCGCLSKMSLSIIRTILMFSCILILTSQIICLWALITFDNFIVDKYFSGFSVDLSDYLVLIMMTVVSCVGIYGAYTKNPQRLKAFAMAMALIAVCSLLFYSDAPKETWAKNHDKFAHQMEEYGNEYQWDKKPGEPVNKPTEIWDIFQKNLQCCGLSGPEDWAKWKVSLKNDVPRSCCSDPSDEQCSIQNSYQTGCMSRLDHIIANDYKRTLIMAVIYLFLAGCALILVEENRFVRQELNSFDAAASQYQRFDGSIYVRQPVSAQFDYNKQPAMVPGYQNGSMYPNIEQTTKVGPPPSYQP